MAFVEINERAGELLRRSRLDRGLSIGGLAHEAELSEAVIRRIESPETTRHRETTVVRVARALGIRVSDLMDVRDGQPVGRHRGTRPYGEPVQVFFSYSHADEGLMNCVRQQLEVRERLGQILKWHDRQIPGGTGWRKQVDDRVRESEVILLFLSPDFIDSEYCYEIEGGIALERHNAKEALVIPVVLRPCDWTITPFGELQAVPRDGKPVSTWDDTDAACLEAARMIMDAIEDFL